MIHGEQVHLLANKQHGWMQQVPDIPRLGSWEEQSSLLLIAFAQASAKVPEVSALGRTFPCKAASLLKQPLGSSESSTSITPDRALRPAKQDTTTLFHQI